MEGISILYQWDIEDLWNLFRSEILQHLDSGKNRQLLETVKNGDKLKVDLRLLLYKDSKEYTRDNKLVFDGRLYSFVDIADELEFRRDLMTNWLKVNLDEGFLSNLGGNE